MLSKCSHYCPTLDALWASNYSQYTPWPEVPPKTPINPQREYFTTKDLFCIKLIFQGFPDFMLTIYFKICLLHAYVGNLNIPTAREYCYLGIVISLTGSLITAQQKLRQKGLRSYFSLKKMIDIRSLRKSTVFKLFDSLILPVAGYGCEVWLPETWCIRNLVDPSSDGELKIISRDPIEKLHLSFLKWTLGVIVNNKTSNAAVWGDTGRFPLVVTLAKQVLKYHNRLQSMDHSNSNSLVRHAYKEQKALNLTWYSRINDLNWKTSELCKVSMPLS